MSPILCDHTLCEHASHEKYYEHSYLVSLLFAETFLLTIIFSKFFSTCGKYKLTAAERTLLTHALDNFTFTCVAELQVRSGARFRASR